MNVELQAQYGGPYIGRVEFRSELFENRLLSRQLMLNRQPTNNDELGVLLLGESFNSVNVTRIDSFKNIPSNPRGYPGFEGP